MKIIVADSSELDRMKLRLKELDDSIKNAREDKKEADKRQNVWTQPLKKRKESEERLKRLNRRRSDLQSKIGPKTKL